MRRGPRRSTPKVRGGRVQRKNRADLSPDIFPWEPGRPIIRRERPGEGYRHLLRVEDVERFLRLLPDWDELAKGLRGVLIAEGDDVMGWHIPGVVAVCAWDREIAGWWDAGFLAEIPEVLDRLGVPVGEPENDRCFVEWTEQSARGFQLMDVLLHELGHHHDRMTTDSQRASARGEAYAQEYAIRYADRIWDRYFAEFGW